MSEHLQESLIGSEVLAWCKKCGRETRHRVDRVAVGSHAGKAGPCMEHGPKEKPATPPETIQAPTGGKEWLVLYLLTNKMQPSSLARKEFSDAEKAAAFYESLPPATASLWRRAGANHQKVKP